jgi:SAM-dependent methyltransferase
MSVTVTGERVSTSKGGFNPTWQRHVAAYRLCSRLLPGGRVLDLGCGVGHSYRELAPRTTVGLDMDARALAGQDRETVRADMRSIPFPDASFASALAVHSIEHVPDPETVFGEIVRVLEPGGTAVLVTPNRLTFARPDEVIDPYHYREFDAQQLGALCRPWFDQVELYGIFGSPPYQAIVAAELRRLERMLRLDPLRLRRLLPRWARKRLYDSLLRRARGSADPAAEAISLNDFEMRDDGLAGALDVVAVCSGPRQFR